MQKKSFCLKLYKFIHLNILAFDSFIKKILFVLIKQLTKNQKYSSKCRFIDIKKQTKLWSFNLIKYKMAIQLFKLKKKKHSNL